MEMFGLVKFCAMTISNAIIVQWSHILWKILFKKKQVCPANKYPLKWVIMYIRWKKSPNVVNGPFKTFVIRLNAADPTLPSWILIYQKCVCCFQENSRFWQGNRSKVRIFTRSPKRNVWTISECVWDESWCISIDFRRDLIGESLQTSVIVTVKRRDLEAKEMKPS